MIPARSLIAVLFCLALSGCYVKTYGLQSSGGGTTATTTSTQVGATAKFSGGRAAFSSGQAVAAGAPGGHASLGPGATAVLITGVALLDLFSYIRGEPKPKELPEGTRIMDTCSCYQKQPVD